MQSIRNGYKSLTFLVTLNWDLMFSVVALLLALLLGVWLSGTVEVSPAIGRV